MTIFYRAVFNGSVMGQDVKNILYYRAGIGVDMSGLPLAGAAALAGNLKQEIWPAMKALLPNQYTLETIDVSPINDEFQLIYQMPHVENVGEQGIVTDETFGTATCAIFKFRLEPQTILNGIKPPSRGYIAFGPVAKTWVGEDGYFINGHVAGAAVAALCTKLSSNIEQLIPAPQTWYPIRLKQTRILGGAVHWESYADVSGCVMSRRVTFRRSRMPEA